MVEVSAAPWLLLLLLWSLLLKGSGLQLGLRAWLSSALALLWWLLALTLLLLPGPGWLWSAHPLLLLLLLWVRPLLLLWWCCQDPALSWLWVRASMWW